jgi:excinuclease ABC subunit A
MHFLPDVYVPCDVCKGRRYNRETLEIRYKGKSIHEVLEMTIEDALEFFRPVPTVYTRLQTLMDVGLSYLKLGQNATTLSGGEAQRVKLAKELSKRATGRTLYILDEPTTGLHFADIEQLLVVLHRLRDEGNTVVVIEHNLDVIKTADWIIDLGPEGGSGGGEIVATGRPEDIVQVKGSYTGQFLKPVLERQRPKKERKRA